MIERTKHGGHITDVDGNIKAFPRLLAGANNQLTFRALQSLTEGVFRITQIESETVLYSVPLGFTLPQIDRE